MKEGQQAVGLLCSDARLVEYYVRLITKIQRFQLKAIWCPDAERSIQLAADNDVPSVSHTAYQLISRADTQVVIIAASKKSVICIGAAALTIECASAMNEFANRFACHPLNVVYPLKYCTPFAILHSSLNKIGTLQNIYVEMTFEERICEKERLCYDALTTLHKYGHEIIDALAWLCSSCELRAIAVTHRERSSVVNHFRLRELDIAHMQIAFGCTVATIRLTASSADSLSIRLRGHLATLYMDAKTITIDHFDGQNVLWSGDGCVESIIHDGIANALKTQQPLSGPSEYSLVQCISASLLQ
ncbi:unnamed protein product [Anisakis simplex]|uniref:PKS_ER domain-containing protein n=1 Tax=Anisakis simplex TaxID=6269 RepID=A0A0M3JTL6_ANISI|nr:unnamed protein product [Anisakis simplex]